MRHLRSFLAVVLVSVLLVLSGCVYTGPPIRFHFGPSCGNLECEAGEDATNCPQDCATTYPKINIEQYYKGDVIIGLTGDGAYSENWDMTVKLIQVTQSGATYNATFELYANDGTLVDTKTVAAGTYLNDKFIRPIDGTYALRSNLYVQTIAIDSNTNAGYVYIQKNIEQYYKGDVILYLTGDGNYLGQDMAVKLVQASDYNATFELYDSAGSLVDTKTVAASKYLNDTFIHPINRSYVLLSNLYVQTIAIDSNTNAGYVYIQR